MSKTTKKTLAEIIAEEKAGTLTPVQLNHNYRNFEAGESEIFEFLGFKEADEAELDSYRSALLRRESGEVVTNADVVLMTTLDGLESEAPFVIKVTCQGLKKPKSGNKEYKDLVILRY